MGSGTLLCRRGGRGPQCSRWWHGHSPSILSGLRPVLPGRQLPRRKLRPPSPLPPLLAGAAGPTPGESPSPSGAPPWETVRTSLRNTREGDGRPPQPPRDLVRAMRLLEADGHCPLIAVSSSSKLDRLNINTNVTLLLRAIAVPRGPRSLTVSRKVSNRKRKSQLLDWDRWQARTLHGLWSVSLCSC